MKAWMSRMSVWPLLLFMVLCLAGSLGAEEAPSMESFLEGLGGIEKAAETGRRLLFYELPKGVEATEGTTVDVRIRHQGRLFVHEKLTLGAVEPGARPAVEILAWNPEKLDEFWRLAGETGSRVRISITVEGRQVADLTFEKLARENETLREWGFQPVQATSEILSPRGNSLGVPQKTERDDCYNRCNLEYEDCEARADPYDPHNEYQLCRDALQQCASFCSNCPYTGSNQTQVVILSTQTVGPRSCKRDHRNLFGQGWYYYPLNVNYKVIVYRRITRCDYTTYTQTVSVNYYTEFCWGRTVTSCHPYGASPSCGIDLYY